MAYNNARKYFYQYAAIIKLEWVGLTIGSEHMELCREMNPVPFGVQ